MSGVRGSSPALLRAVRLIGAAGLLIPLAVAGLAGSATASGASKPPIKLGLIMSLTGVAASSYTNGQYGAVARIDAQNAAGGVDGHKLQLIVKDDASSPSQNTTAAQDLVQNAGVFGVIDFSSFTFAAAPYLHSAGIPVTSWAVDGPEWIEQPYTNMFDVNPPTLGPINGVYYYYLSGLVKFLKSTGITKLAGLSYGISPSAQRATNQLLQAAKKDAGIATCYNNSSVPFGAVDFTADVLSMKSAGCNGVNAAFVDSSDIALSSEVKQAGLHAVQYYETGYDQSVIDNPSALAAMDGDYVAIQYNFIRPNAATAKMLANLVRYDPKFHKGDIPSMGTYGSYLAADLMIKGLQLAGKNPTRQKFITNLRKDCNYTAEGVLPSPTSMCHFGTLAMLPKQFCTYLVQLRGTHFVLANGGKPLCSIRQAQT